MKIDFIIIWVDGNDQQWKKEKDFYAKELTRESDDSIHRYRDWDNLHYWFRGVEVFCPWVHKIHFVTWGHLPSWLNINHPKLNIVLHKDYIPSEYLPTFSSHTIELNLHRISELSNYFVYFNDDMFIINYTKEEDFFIKNKPCDSAILNVHCYNIEDMVIMAPFRNIGIINHEYNMHKVIQNNILKWFNVKYGINNFRTLILMACPRFPGLLQQHLPSSFLKTTFYELWNKYYNILHETCKHKFRNMTDVNQWLMKDWQIVQGNFFPRSLKIGKSIPAYKIDRACEYIKRQQGKMLCLNDTIMTDEEFARCKHLVNLSFDKILPKKSSFEL